jgi:hypothetical protein
MSQIDLNDPYASELEELEPSNADGDGQTSLGPDATVDEVFALSQGEAVAWLEANHPGKSFAQVFSAPRSGPQGDPEPTEDKAPEDDLEGLSEGELLLMIDTTMDRIEDPLEAKEVAELREGGGPDGSPSRLAALRAAAARALQVAGPVETIEYPVGGSTTFVDVNGDYVSVELDVFGRRTRELSRISAEQLAEIEAARGEVGTDDPAKVTLSDVATWSADRWARFDEANPTKAEALRRQEGDNRDELVNRAANGIV